MKNITDGKSSDEKFLLWLKYEYRGQEMEVCEMCQVINAWDDTYDSIDIDNQAENKLDNQIISA